jgi:MFS family permease
MFIPQAACQNIQTMLIARFLSGISASVGATMVGGTISDIFENKDRGTPMNLFGVGSICGTGIGPFIAGFIWSNPRLGWRYRPPLLNADGRWVFWIQLIVNLVWLAVIILLLPETRGSVILRRRVKKLQQQTGDMTLVAVGDESRATITTLIKISTTRPLMLLFTEHIVFWFSLWVGFTWGILYLFLNTIDQVMVASHGFTTEQVGLAFIGVVVGGLIGFATSPIQDWFYSRAAKKAGGDARPEARLLFSCGGTLMFASGLFWFGWSSGPNVHWIVPILGITWSIIGIYTIYVPVPLPNNANWGRRPYSIILRIHTRYIRRRPSPPKVLSEIYLAPGSRCSVFR